MKEILKQEHSGAVAFEYVIILAMMATAIFSCFSVLSARLAKKAEEISTFIQNNGKDDLGTGN